MWLPRPSSTLLESAYSASMPWSGNRRHSIGAKGTVDPETCSSVVGCGDDPKGADAAMRVGTRERSAALDRPARSRPALSTIERAALSPCDQVDSDRRHRARKPRRKSSGRERQPLARRTRDLRMDRGEHFRDPAVKGCGTGDIRWMLETGSLGGKCADLNALFVGLCRHWGCRRVTCTAFASRRRCEYKSLGRDGDVTTAQHCRAEVFIDDIGWVPVDPADVRKVVLEEAARSHARRSPPCSGRASEFSGRGR